jgi:hypothetical protein
MTPAAQLQEETSPRLVVFLHYDYRRRACGVSCSCSAASRQHWDPDYRRDLGSLLDARKLWRRLITAMLCEYRSAVYCVNWSRKLARRSRRAETLLRPSECPRLAVLACNRVGLFAALDHLPLIECIVRHEAATPDERTLNGRRALAGSFVQ